MTVLEKSNCQDAAVFFMRQKPYHFSPYTMSCKGDSSGGYIITSAGTIVSDGSSGYHYFNTNGSYYYRNPNGSSYYLSRSGYLRYTSPGGLTYSNSTPSVGSPMQSCCGRL
ncbi:uncharacterized protein LAESUDRAFT_713746 [Laetiporus sulphureus 93-53]|uniref:Uncharacterized protein n=1 Tax=Laetiporus sulphureus 93-53 TaxID=1314785 RepID=A0A165EL10_9APHY|nr:uncharacterized protein LAESUDRAFT_713746 [Laetiporus sulphureus 93-53]KZT07278.1 hypothetical protein LAESUDRAFT_713746 [Laetiporus sulphureus 93-53]